MIEADLDAFTKAWRSAGALYGEKWTPNAQSIALVFRALQHYEIGDVLLAISNHVRDPDQGQFAPKPADIVRQIEGTAEARAREAWDKVRGAVRRVGQWQHVCFDDPVIHAVIEAMGGWVGIAEMDEDAVPFREKDFMARYRQFVSRPLARYPKALSGAGGDKRIAIVGDAEAARRVYAGGSDQAAIGFQSIAALAAGVEERKPAALEMKHAA